jgi:hypothetical protein
MTRCSVAVAAVTPDPGSVCELLRRVSTLEAANAAQQARLDELERQVEALTAARAPRDEQDRALRRQIALSTKGLRFTALWLLEHGDEDHALKHALAAATLQSVDEVGSWLRDHRGDADGVCIERLQRRRWRAYTSNT